MTRQRKDIILVVDDQPANLRILLSFLQERNFELRVLQSGMQAIAMLQDITPDIILLDIVMPEMDGFETCRKIKANKTLADIPVIFMTALDTLEDKVAGFEAGGVDYITKPFQQIEVLVRINTHISLRKKAIKLKENKKELLRQKEILCKNINALRQARQQVEEERERLSVTLNSIGDGVISTDVEGGAVFINRAAEQLTGWSNAEASGRPSDEFFNIFDEETGEKSVSPVDTVLRTGKNIGFTEHNVLLRRDGTELNIADSGAPIRDKDNRVIGVVIIFRDVTEEKKMEEERTKIRKLESIGVLAGGIAHDFNNILSAILGNIELASSRVDQGGKTFSLLADAQKATRRATRLTHQLLTFSKGGEPIKEETSLIELIRESASFVLHGSLVSCDYIFADNLWMIHADSGQISQVIQNMILNAKDSMPDGGKITISCSNVEDLASGLLVSQHKGDFVHITIQDTGDGIPHEIMDKIFDPYFTTKKKGNGLGLAICHSIIKKHGGHITVRPDLRQGTIFSIYLPAAAPRVDSATDEQRQEKSALRSTKIMVMDDDPMLRDLAKAQLNSLGHEAVLARDGAEAISIYQKMLESDKPVDLVMLDLTIPGGMGGREAAQKLLLINSEAKLIVTSGYANDPVLADCEEHGFHASVAKPFNMKELSDVIASALRQVTISPADKSSDD